VAYPENSSTTQSAGFGYVYTSMVAVLAAALALGAVGTLCLAQETPQEPPRLAADEHTDAHIAEAIRQVSADHIRQTIEHLVSFGNRSTISAQDEESIKAGKGIGAAREWIKAEFERYAKDCGGCLEVKTDAFTEQPGERIRKPTEITNVYAVLRGSDPKQADRIVLVTGHYDSRNSDTFNGTDPAPGANDDGSGTAVSLECARVLSQAAAKLKFPATIIFLTVAGEEQGLNGSKHFAEMAKQQGWKI
jgi:acetylornithine deacetylase/succinyl-diaminopimelate desuccinylase-like protein